MDTPDSPEPPQPPPPDKDSASYKNLRASLKRSADKHFAQPQAAPPSVQQAQNEDPSLAHATPPGSGDESAGTAPSAPSKKQKQVWIKHPALRGVVIAFLLGLTAYCLWFILRFHRNGQDGPVWWPWEKPPVVAKRIPTTTTTTVKSGAEQQDAKTAQAEEARRKLEEKKKADAEAAAKAAAELKKKQEADAAKTRLESDEAKSLVALEASLSGYLQKFHLEQAAQQMAQLGGSLTTEQAQSRWQQLWAGFQPLVAFKQTLIGNIASVPYSGAPITNRQGGNTPGNPVKADEENIYFHSSHGSVGMEWDTIAPAQIATLASYYLHEREIQGGSKTLAQDYYNLAAYCLWLKLPQQAASAGNTASRIDPTIHAKVKALLGNLVS